MLTTSRCSAGRRLVAVLALAMMLSGAWLAVVHGGLSGRDACADDVGAPPASRGAAIGKAAGVAAPDQCPICQWLQSFHAPAPGAPLQFSSDLTARPVCVPRPTRRAGVALAPALGRAPPA